MKLAMLLILTVLAAEGKTGIKKLLAREQPESALDRYIREAEKAQHGPAGPSPGSLYSIDGLFAEVGGDLRAARLNDIVTIVVSDRASALSKGATTTSRKSSAKSSVTQLAGALKASSALSNLAGMTGDQQLQGAGQTSRDTSLTTNLTARVTHVLPNGYLVLEGAKDITINSERHLVSVRGIIRPIDLSPANSIPSDRLADAEIRVNGKGVVGDAIRRPHFLYRLLLGLLPF